MKKNSFMIKLYEVLDKKICGFKLEKINYLEYMSRNKYPSFLEKGLFFKFIKMEK
jgi:hypothetical protein